MPHVKPLLYDQAQPLQRTAMEQAERAHGRLTNMKRTLARSPVALRSLMTWYDLRDSVETFVGARATLVFAHAISTATDCLICSTFFRRLLRDSGEDPDALVLDDVESLLAEYGRQIASNPNQVSNDLADRLSNRFNAEQLVELTAFAGLMVATNLFNNALRVELDEYLWPYRRVESRESTV